MWTFVIVVMAPILNHDLSFLQRVEDFSVQEFVAQTSVEALDITIFPCTARQALLCNAERGLPGLM